LYKEEISREQMKYSHCLAIIFNCEQVVLRVELNDCKLIQIKKSLRKSRSYDRTSILNTLLIILERDIIEFVSKDSNIKILLRYTTPKIHLHSFLCTLILLLNCCMI
jgi:hypothetical protein